jgi:hypothetical protein
MRLLCNIAPNKSEGDDIPDNKFPERAKLDNPPGMLDDIIPIIASCSGFGGKIVATAVYF